MTLNAQMVGRSRKREVAALLRANVFVVIDVPEVFDASEQSARARARLGPAQVVAHLTVVLVRKGFRRHSSRLGRRSAVTYKARCVRRFGLFVLRAGPRLFDLLVTIAAMWALTRFELRPVERIVDRHDAKISGQNLPMSLM